MLVALCYGLGDMQLATFQRPVYCDYLLARLDLRERFLARL
jgi:hypothetical protein